MSSTDRKPSAAAQLVFGLAVVAILAACGWRVWLTHPLDGRLWLYYIITVGVIGAYVSATGYLLGRRRRAAARLLDALAADDPSWDRQQLRWLATQAFRQVEHAACIGRPRSVRALMTEDCFRRFSARCAELREPDETEYQLTSVQIVGVDDQPDTAHDRWWVLLTADRPLTHRRLGDHATTESIEVLWRFDRASEQWLVGEMQSGALAVARLGAHSAELDAVPPGALSRATGHERDDDRGLSLTNQPD